MIRLETHVNTSKHRASAGFLLVLTELTLAQYLNYLMHVYETSVPYDLQMKDD